MIIRCTQKLLKELRIKPAEPEVVNDVGNWHANLLRIERRKCVIFTHDKTLFTLFVAGLKRPDFDRIDHVFGQKLFRAMRLFEFDQVQIERMLDWSQHNTYTKTNNRSVIGSMNDMAYHVEHRIYADGGLARANLDELLMGINQIPFKAIGFNYPKDRLREMLSA